MKALLVAINAKYIHSNLAVYSLKAYAEEKFGEDVGIVEYTINNQTDYILQEVYKKKPEFVGFSCYIWNIELVREIAKELRKLLPDVKMWFGGPEVSYDADERLLDDTFLDGIMVGEGEETFLELMEYYFDDQGCKELDKIGGIAFRGSARRNVKSFDVKKGSAESEGEICVTQDRVPMELGKIPFPYEDMGHFENKIVYYETSRGCPYSCSYCLSSVDKRVRFRDIEMVKRELLVFIEHRIPQVKFIDRTFNCNRKHSMEIWRFIKEHDNGITNYHFEISADLLTQEELELIGSFRKGLIQLEIGVQSTNLETIGGIDRKMDFEKLSEVVRKINGFENTHQHLDLIAGLPYEGYESFRNSFNDVYALRPEQLQLGFLKVLKGSPIYRKRENHEIVYKDNAPYEVLYTKWLSYEEVLALKEVEEMVEVYYNSGQFTYGIKYLETSFATPFDLYAELGKYYEENGLFDKSHARISRYYILRDFYRSFLVQQEIEAEDRSLREEAFDEVLIYDLYLRENMKSRPDFGKSNEAYKKLYREFYEREVSDHKYLIGYEPYNSKQISRMIHMEHFNYSIPELVENGELRRKEIFVVFDYQQRNPLNHEARTVLFPKDEFTQYTSVKSEVVLE